jgi:hypothetical protein
MLAFAPYTDYPPVASARELVSYCFVRSKYRYESSFGRAAGIDSEKVGPWLRGDHLPTLPSQLKLCFLVQVSPSEFLTGKVATDHRDLERTARRHPRTLKATKGVALDALSRQETERVLLEAQDLQPPKPLRAFQRETGWSTRRMKTHFPLLCRNVINRYKAAYKKPVDIDRCQRVLKAGLKDKRRPPLSDVAIEVGCGAKVLKKLLPDLSKQVIARHAKNRYKLDWKTIRLRLKDSLVQKPAPSLRGIARDLNTTVSAMTRKFPQLCEAIGARSVLHRTEARQKSKELVREEVIKTARFLQSQDIYPSVMRVLSHMKLTSNSTAVHKILRELRL